MGNETKSKEACCLWAICGEEDFCELEARQDQTERADQPTFQCLWRRNCPREWDGPPKNLHHLLEGASSTRWGERREAPRAQRPGWACCAICLPQGLKVPPAKQGWEGLSCWLLTWAIEPVRAGKTFPTNLGLRQGEKKRNSPWTEPHSVNWMLLKKLQVRLPCRPAIPLLGISSRGVKAHVHRFLVCKCFQQRYS